MSYFFKRFLGLPLVILWSIGFLTFVTGCACSAPKGEPVPIFLVQNNETKETQNEKVIKNVLIIRSKILQDFLKIEKEPNFTRENIKEKLSKKLTTNENFRNFYFDSNTSYCKIEWNTKSEKVNSDKEKNFLPLSMKGNEDNLSWNWKTFLRKKLTEEQRKNGDSEEQWSHWINISKIKTKDGIIKDDTFNYRFSNEKLEQNNPC